MYARRRRLRRRFDARIGSRSRKDRLRAQSVAMSSHLGLGQADPTG
jgi:hypothetical protein